MAAPVAAAVEEEVKEEGDVKEGGDEAKEEEAAPDAAVVDSTNDSDNINNKPDAATAAEGVHTHVWSGNSSALGVLLEYNAPIDEKIAVLTSKHARKALPTLGSKSGHGEGDHDADNDSVISSSEDSIISHNANTSSGSRTRALVDALLCGKAGRASSAQELADALIGATYSEASRSNGAIGSGSSIIDDALDMIRAEEAAVKAEEADILAAIARADAEEAERAAEAAAAEASQSSEGEESEEEEAEESAILTRRSSDESESDDEKDDDEAEEERMMALQLQQLARAHQAAGGRPATRMPPSKPTPPPPPERYASSASAGHSSSRAEMAQAAQAATRMPVPPVPPARNPPMAPPKPQPPQRAQPQAVPPARPQQAQQPPQGARAGGSALPAGVGWASQPAGGGLPPPGSRGKQPAAAGPSYRSLGATEQQPQPPPTLPPPRVAAAAAAVPYSPFAVPTLPPTSNIATTFDAPPFGLGLPPPPSAIAGLAGQLEASPGGAGDEFEQMTMSLAEDMIGDLWEKTNDDDGFFCGAFGSTWPPSTARSGPRKVAVCRSREAAVTAAGRERTKRGLDQLSRRRLAVWGLNVIKCAFTFTKPSLGALLITDVAALQEVQASHRLFHSRA